MRACVCVREISILWNVNSQSVSTIRRKCVLLITFSVWRWFPAMFFIFYFLPLWWTEALYINSWECNISRALRGNLFLLCTNVHSNSEMNWWGFGGERLKVTATSRFMNWYLSKALSDFCQIWHKHTLAHKDELIRFWKSKITETCHLVNVVCGTNIYIHSRMNWLDFGGTRLKVTATSCFMNTTFLLGTWVHLVSRMD